MTATLPPQHTEGRYRIALVCLGNICRSPMAHVVLESHVERAGLGDRVALASSGTGDWHVGKPMDQRAAATLHDAGHDPSRHRAQQFDAGWLTAYDAVLVMDAANESDVLALAGTVDGAPLRVMRFRAFDPVDPGGEVPDPYYGGGDGFREVLDMVERTSAEIVGALRTGLQP